MIRNRNYILDTELAEPAIGQVTYGAESRRPLLQLFGAKKSPGENAEAKEREYGTIHYDRIGSDPLRGLRPLGPA